MRGFSLADFNFNKITKGPIVYQNNKTESFNNFEFNKPKTANMRRFSENEKLKKPTFITEGNNENKQNYSEKNNLKAFEIKLNKDKHLTVQNNNNRFETENKKLKTTENFFQRKNEDISVGDPRQEFKNNENSTHNNFSSRNNNEKSSNNFLSFQKNYAKEYERIIKTSHQDRRKTNIIDSREVNYKMLESDIFFFKNTDEEKKNFFKEKKVKPKTAIKKENPLDSDIFYLKNNEKSFAKIGEVSLLKDRQMKNYHNSQRSNSDWSPKKLNFKSFINHHSKEYDIITPDIYNKKNTKNTLITDANGNNPAKKLKGLSEFNDLARVGIPNPNKELVEAFKNNEKIFLKNDQMCNDFMNLYKQYGSICDKPFTKKII